MTISKAQYKKAITQRYQEQLRSMQMGSLVAAMQGGGHGGISDDMLYIREKLFSTLKVPQSMIGPLPPGDEEVAMSSQYREPDAMLPEPGSLISVPGTHQVCVFLGIDVINRCWVLGPGSAPGCLMRSEFLELLERHDAVVAVAP